MSSQKLLTLMPMVCKRLARMPNIGLVNQITSKRHFLPSRRDIQRSFDSFFRDLERTFPSFYQLSPLSPLSRSIPMETIENGQRIFKIEIDLPYFKPENINVTVKKGEVIIDAKLEITEGSSKQSKQVNYCYSLPDEVDLDKVRSLLKTDGRLVIEAPLPQLEQQPENREIPIKRE
ncbi:Heat shock protein Hsp-16.1/Hsp-16.11 [Sarcoptes scabiei]|nr:Heat shock protein Hsp-16.1/Hsp-16.11 [Sarcoptes scabiei]